MRALETAIHAHDEEVRTGRQEVRRGVYLEWQVAALVMPSRLAVDKDVREIVYGRKADDARCMGTIEAERRVEFALVPRGPQEVVQLRQLLVP